MSNSNSNRGGYAYSDGPSYHHISRTFDQNAGYATYNQYQPASTYDSQQTYGATNVDHTTHNYTQHATASSNMRSHSGREHIDRASHPSLNTARMSHEARPTETSSYPSPRTSFTQVDNRTAQTPNTSYFPPLQQYAVAKPGHTSSSHIYPSQSHGRPRRETPAQPQQTSITSSSSPPKQYLRLHSPIRTETDRAQIPSFRPSSASSFAPRSASPLFAPGPRKPFGYQTQESSATSSPTYHNTVDPSHVYDPLHDIQRRARLPEAEIAHRASPTVSQIEANAPVYLQKSVASTTPSTSTADVNKKTSLDRPILSMAAAHTSSKVPAASSASHDTVPRAMHDSTAVEMTKTNNESRRVKHTPKSRKPRTNKVKPNNEIYGGPRADSPAQAAAMTLMQSANSERERNGEANSPILLEAKMKAMFKQMRSFHEADPEMLARLWQQEKNDHINATSERRVVLPPSTVAATDGASKKVKANTAAKYSEKRPPDSDAGVSPLISKRPVPVASEDTNITSLSTVNAKQKPRPQDVQNIVQGSEQRAGTIDPLNPALQSMPASSAITNMLPRRTTTIWPVDKKAALAAAAARILLNNNNSPSISANQVSDILNTNPTYIQLCEELERLGSTLDRSIFAKALVAAVPEVNKTPHPYPGIPPSPNLGNADKRTDGATSEISAEPITYAVFAEAAKRLVQGESLVATHVPLAIFPSQKEDEPGSRINGTSSQSKPNKPTKSTKLPNASLEGVDSMRHFNEGKWESFERPALAPTPTPTATSLKNRKAPLKARPSVTPAPPTKKDLAKKKTFLDLVDLTQLSEHEDDTLSSQPLHQEGIDLTVDVDMQVAQVPSSTADVPMQPSSVKGPRPAGLETAALAPAISTAVLSKSGPATSLHNAGSGVAIALKPVSTVSAIPSLPAGHPARFIELVKPWDKYKAIRRSAYSSRTIARDVLLACGRHPDIRQLNAHLEILKIAFPTIDNNADLSTFRWDVIDPGGVQPGSATYVARPSIHDAVTVDDTEDELHSLDDILHQERDARRQVVRPAGMVAMRQVVRPAAMVAMRQVVRPAGMVAMQGRFAVPGYSTLKRKRVLDPGSARSGIRTHNPSTGAAGTPHVGAAPKPVASMASSGYAAMRAAHTDSGSEPVRKRGRPVGWRKWMMKGHTGPPANAAPVVAPGAEDDTEPDYKVYKCEWQDCGTELHNLATLRKHIFKLHSRHRVNGQLACLWQHCSRTKTTTESRATSPKLTRRTFDAAAAWRAHIEASHLKPIAWQLGDGPAGGVSDFDGSSAAASEAYLSDAHGRRVTPQIVISDERALRVATDPSVARDLSHKPAKPSHEQVERDVRAAEERRRRAIGPGIDRGGARLANDKRRMGLLDDDNDAMRIVDD